MGARCLLPQHARLPSQPISRLPETGQIRCCFPRLAHDCISTARRRSRPRSTRARQPARCNCSMAYAGPYNVAPKTAGGQVLIADTQAKLAQLLEQDSLDDTSLSEFLAVVLSTETSREAVEAQLTDLLEDLTPKLLEWWVHAAPPSVSISTRTPTSWMFLISGSTRAACWSGGLGVRIDRHAYAHPLLISHPRPRPTGCTSSWTTVLNATTLPSQNHCSI